MTFARISMIVLAAWAALLAPAVLLADDADRLGGILINGEDWQPAADGLGFADGGSADVDGNFYFCDMRAKIVYRLTPDGAKSKVADGSMSGVKIGPDGKIYACGGGKAVAYDMATGSQTVLASGLSTNDLVVTPAGRIYLTETGKKQVTLLDPKTGQTRPVDTGINKPNGIALSPDRKTLYVSDYGGVNVYSFAIQPDGTLADKKPAMKMRAPANKPDVAGGDGMTVDTDGRAYVTSALGLQIFDPKGELLGVLPKPANGPLTNVCFAGKDLHYLYMTCGTKVFRRKVQTKGFLFFQAPAAP